MCRREEARHKEKFMQGKVYNYKLHKGDLLKEIAKQGRCKVLARSYSEKFDCDLLCVVDLDTKETIYANQYALKLKEIRD